MIQIKELMVNENLKKLDLNKLRDELNRKADEVLNLDKDRITLETGMKERFGEIDIHQDLLKTQLRSNNEELQTVSCELKDRMAKVEKLKKRYDITMVSMAPPEGTPQEENSQAYYVIKAAQEKEELQREGDDLDAKIKKAEKELRALENTLEVVNSNNDNYKQSYSKAGSQSNKILVFLILSMNLFISNYFQTRRNCNTKRRIRTTAKSTSRYIQIETKTIETTGRRFTKYGRCL